MCTPVGNFVILMFYMKHVYLFKGQLTRGGLVCFTKRGTIYCEMLLVHCHLNDAFISCQMF